MYAYCLNIETHVLCCFDLLERYFTFLIYFICVLVLCILNVIISTYSLNVILSEMVYHILLLQTFTRQTVFSNTLNVKMYQTLYTVKLLFHLQEFHSVAGGRNANKCIRQISLFLLFCYIQAYAYQISKCICTHHNWLF